MDASRFLIFLKNFPFLLYVGIFRRRCRYLRATISRIWASHRARSLGGAIRAIESGFVGDERGIFLTDGARAIFAENASLLDSSCLDAPELCVRLAAFV